MDSSDSDVFTSKKIYKCSFSGCSACFSKNRKLLVHVRKHTGERPFICDEPNCHKTYTNNSHLRRHKKNSHGNNETAVDSVICEYDGCGAILANKYSLKKHYNRKHNSELYQFKCKDCSQGFHRKKHLQQHISVHTGEPVFSCEQCDMCFMSLGNFNKHKRSHRTYVCDCGVKFYRWSAILAHKKTCKDMSYCCEICQKKFSHLGNFKSHQLVHQNKSEKNVFVCPHDDCKRFYFYKKNLKFHVDTFHKKVNADKNFKCTYADCDKILKTKQSLKHHLEKHFQWKKINVRKERSDKGKPKKSVMNILLGQQMPQNNKTDINELNDPLLTECDLALNLLNQQTVANC